MKIDTLCSAVHFLNERHSFKQGDVVVWKTPDLRCSSQPEIGQPVVVVAVLEEAVIGQLENSERCDFNARLDLVVAIYNYKTKSILEFHFDSRRFRHATQEEIAAWDAGHELRQQEAQKQDACDCQTLREFLSSITKNAANNAKQVTAEAQQQPQPQPEEQPS